VVARRFLNADYAHEVSFARVTATRLSLYEGQVWRVVYDDGDREELIWAELSAALELKASLSRTTPASPRTRSRSQSSAEGETSEAPSEPGEEVEVEEEAQPAQLRYTGVWAKGKRFTSRLNFRGQKHSCGTYDTAEDAARARAAKLRSLELQEPSGKRARGSISEGDEDAARRSTRKRLSAAPHAPVVRSTPIIFRGVYATGSKFWSSVCFKGRQVYCSTYDTALAAARARDARILKLGWPTHLLNFPDAEVPSAAPADDGSDSDGKEEEGSRGGWMPAEDAPSPSALPPLQAPPSASAGGAPEQQQLLQRAAPFFADAATQTELRDMDAAWLRAALLTLQDSDSIVEL